MSNFNSASFGGGKAIFTNPCTAVNCGGAPQKIAYLAEAEWRKRGRNRVRNGDASWMEVGCNGL